MNRLQKKSLIASLALHAILCVILVVGPAFLSSKKTEPDLPILEVIPDKLTDARAYGGGNPSAKPPPPAPQVQPAQLQPPVQQTKPSEPVAKQSKTESKPPAEPQKEKEAQTEPDAVSFTTKREKPKPQLQVETKIVKRPANPRPDKTTRKTEAEDAKARARAEAEARRRVAQQLLARINGASERLENLSSSTKIETLGPGGEAFANYGQAIVSIYKQNWIKPAQIEETVVVKTLVTVARTGRVVSARIVRRSGNPPVDKSVQQVLEAVTSLPPFPEGSTDETRAFDIDFELRPNRSAG